MSDDSSAGRLEDQPFAALVGRLFREGRTGELTLESGHRRRRVFFLGGNPVAVASEDPQDHTAQVLLEHGKISAEQAAKLAELPEIVQLVKVGEELEQYKQPPQFAVFPESVQFVRTGEERQQDKPPPQLVAFPVTVQPVRIGEEPEQDKPAP